jgi:hypothetical protein
MGSVGDCLNAGKYIGVNKLGGSEHPVFTFAIHPRPWGCPSLLQRLYVAATARPSRTSIHASGLGPVSSWDFEFQFETDAKSRDA